jgi:hypothetical protein
MVEHIHYFDLPRDLAEGFGDEEQSFLVLVVDGNRSHMVSFTEFSKAADRAGLKSLVDLVISTGVPFTHDDPQHPGGGRLDCFSWSAWYNREPGGTPDPRLHVSGDCTSPVAGVKLTLELANVGVVPDPTLLALELHAEQPEVSDQVVTPITVTWAEDVGPDIKTVRIDGAAAAQVEVRIAQ